ncbi:MAG: caspase family protein, partial [Deltaproteobacteria bacterium]|nr:caspase family protein [Deltaproteobacteria bacterium]
MTAGLRLVLPIVCLLAAGAARATWPSVSTELPATGIGANDAAVIVGVTDYAFLPKIPGAADNATDWFRYLVKTRGVPQERVHMLRNIDATAETILEAVDRAASEVQPGGALWFLFIGHGAPAPDHADGLVLGADTQVSEKSLVARGVPQKAILERLEQGRHAQAIVMFDACFSGTTGDGKLQLVPGSQATVPVRRVEVAAGRSSIFSASDQVAGPLPNHDRPAFSYL